MPRNAVPYRRGARRVTLARQLDWVQGDRAHSSALNSFICADPPNKVYDGQRTKTHPRPWQLEVQSHFRRMRFPIAERSQLLLGYIDSELATICELGFDQAGDDFRIDTIATRVDFQNQGFGKQALDRALETITVTRETYSMKGEVITRIHYLNEPSQHLFQRAGFVPVALVDGEYETWILDS